MEPGQGEVYNSIGVPFSRPVEWCDPPSQTLLAAARSKHPKATTSLWLVTGLISY